MSTGVFLAPAAVSADEGTAQRNIRLVMAARAPGEATGPIVISLGGLVGQQLSPEPAPTTLPVSRFDLGLAATSSLAGVRHMPGDVRSRSGSIGPQ